MYLCLDIKFDVNKMPVFTSMMFLNHQVNHSYVLILYPDNKDINGGFDTIKCNEYQKTAHLILAKNRKLVFDTINMCILKFKPDTIIHYHDNEKSLLMECIQSIRSKKIISLKSRFELSYPLIFKYDLDEVSRTLLNAPKNCMKFPKACTVLSSIQKSDIRSQLKLIRYSFNDLYLIQFLIRDTNILQIEPGIQSKLQVYHYKTTDTYVNNVYGYVKSNTSETNVMYDTNVVCDTNKYFLSTKNRFNNITPDAFFPKVWLVSENNMILVKEPFRLIFIGHDPIFNDDIPIKKRIIKTYMAGKDVFKNLIKEIKEEEFGACCDLNLVLEEIFFLLKRLRLISSD